MPQFWTEARIEKIVPIGNPDSALSWYGGNPRMPKSVPWPMVGEEPMLFLAQLHCGDFPDALWGGAGPRTGWLLVFIGSTPDTGNSYPAKVVHVDEMGPERCLSGIEPVPWLRIDREREPSEGAVLPKWPVRIHEHIAGTPEAYVSYASPGQNAAANRPRPAGVPWPGGAAGHPLTQGRLHEMLDAMQKDIENRIHELESTIEQSDAVVADGDSYKQHHRDVSRSFLSELSEAMATNEASLEQLSAIQTGLTPASTDSQLAQDTWLDILGALECVKIITIKWKDVVRETAAVMDPVFEVKTAEVERKLTWGEQLLVLESLGMKLSANSGNMLKAIKADERRISAFLAAASMDETALAIEQRKDVERMRRNIARTEQARKVQAKSSDILGPLNTAARARDEDDPVTDEEWTSIVSNVAKLSYAECTWRVAVPAVPAVRTIEFHNCSIAEPLSVQPWKGWAHKFEEKRRQAVFDMYVADPDGLPSAVRLHFESVWASAALDCYDGMGGNPRWDSVNPMIFGGPIYYSPSDKERWVQENWALPEPPFDKDNALLLQLFSDDIMNWMWGDVSHMCLIVPRQDLARNRIDRIMVVVGG